jgi:chitodextrinase
VTVYRVFRNGTPQANVQVPTLSYADTTVTPGLTYSYTIQAFDSAGNQSPLSNSLQITVPAAPPVTNTCSPVPTGVFLGCYYSNLTLSGNPVFTRTDPQINFDWGGNVPDRSISRGGFSVLWQGNFSLAQGVYTFTAVTSDGMRLAIDGTTVLNQWNDQSPTTYTVQQTLSAGNHLITVEYFEATGTSSAHLTWQGAGAVVQPPSILSFTAAPSTVAAGQASTLSWSVNGASSIAIDNGVGTVSGATSISVSPANTTTYTLTASNGAGSATAKSTVTVTALQDTQPPTVPTLVTAVYNGTNAVNLNWAPSSDNVGVAGYQILKNGSPAGTVAGSTLSYGDTAITPGATYSYSVKAYDAAGNYSAASNSLAVSIPGASAPVLNGTCPAAAVGAFTGCYYSNTALSGQPAMVRTDSQINFDWGGNPPDRSVGRSAFSVQWQGSFQFTGGTYTFSATTSDGMRLYIDGNLVMDHWTNQSATQYTATQTLSQGSHVVMVQYYEATGMSTAHLTWH